MVQQPACIGPMASMGRARVIITSIRRRKNSSNRCRLMSTRSRMPASFSLSPTTSSTRAASWTFGARGAPVQIWLGHRLEFLEAARPKTRNFRAAAKFLGPDVFPENRRPAPPARSNPAEPRGARRRWSSSDADHPDVEDYIEWKVKEEHKGRGSRHRLQGHEKSAEGDSLRACVNCEGPGDDCFNPEKNPALKKEIKLARRAFVPDASIKKTIQMARQGQTDIDFETFATDWDKEAYLTVSGPKLQQFRPRHRCFSARGRGGRRLEPDPPTRWQGA